MNEDKGEAKTRYQEESWATDNEGEAPLQVHTVQTAIAAEIVVHIISVSATATAADQCKGRKRKREKD